MLPCRTIDLGPARMCPFVSSVQQSRATRQKAITPRQRASTSSGVRYRSAAKKPYLPRVHSPRKQQRRRSSRPAISALLPSPIPTCQQRQVCRRKPTKWLSDHGGCRRSRAQDDLEADQGCAGRSEGSGVKLGLSGARWPGKDCAAGTRALVAKASVRGADLVPTFERLDTDARCCSTSLRIASLPKASGSAPCVVYRPFRRSPCV